MGRKPDARAVRRGGTKPVEAVVLPAPTVDKPAHVAAEPVMSRCWDTITTGMAHLTPADVPLLEQYCYWYLVFRQCMASTVLDDGGVSTLYGRTYPDGTVDPLTVKANPDIATAAKASAMMKQIGSELEVTPTGRARAGLVDAMTKSTQADVIKKTQDGFAEFRKRLGGGPGKVR
jgi:P27 family predicted phage terminase small subunit